MITAWSPSAAAAGLRSPGLYLQHADALPPAPPPASGMPVFAGFGKWRRPAAGSRRHGQAQFEDCGSLADFDAAVVPHENGYLRDAVAGFFDNGGRRCIVMLASPAGGEASRVAAMLRLMQPDGALEACDLADLVCLPDAVCRELVSDPQLQWSLQAALLEHCRRTGERFAILDAPWLPDQEALRLELSARVLLPSPVGAMYFPWVIPCSWRAAPNGLQDERDAQWRCTAGGAGRRALAPSRPVPPCGHVAGLYARMDAENGGPHRAPANAALLGVADVTLALSREQQGLLSQGRVNCIEHITGHGIRVGGARTLTGNAACSYVPTARVLIAFRRWLAHGLRDIVFESLTPALWDAIRLRLWLRCFDLWQAGALAGIQESEAFSVQCDRETNPPSVQEHGQVVALVRLAPSVPAEFIDVRVVHDANGFTTSGP